LARDLGCTFEELGRRMSALEFAQMQVMYENEGLNPESQRIRHAETLAATLQGASTRKDGKPWSAAHFLGADPWRAAAAPAQVLPRANVMQQVQAMNARRSRKDR
jgi:hypothetical protein